jgi:hypothetical protein
MANRSDFQTVLLVGALTLLVGGAGLYLGFNTSRTPRAKGGTPVPHVPDTGPIVYEMRSVRSDPDRVRLEWREIEGARAYRVTVMSAEDESLFASPELTTTNWTIPSDLRTGLGSGNIYHWKVTVLGGPGEPVRASEPSVFATQ